MPFSLNDLVHPGSGHLKILSHVYISKLKKASRFFIYMSPDMCLKSIKFAVALCAVFKCAFVRLLFHMDF